MSKKKSVKEWKKLIKEKKKYQNLQNRYDEMNEYLLELIETNRDAQEELRYLRSFITYKKQDDDYAYFKKYAHEEENPDLPFSNLVL